MYKVSILFFNIIVAYAPLAEASELTKTIHLIASSAAYDEAQIPNIVQALEAKGLSVSTKYLNQNISDFGYVDTDRARAKILIEALKDSSVRYLWFVRGGNGAFKLLPYLEQHKDEIKLSSPKTLIGFSDVTALHGFINKRVGWPSVHGVTASKNKELVEYNHVASSNEILTSIDSVIGAIDDGVDYPSLLPINAAAFNGVSGSLAGGNLSLIQAAFGTIFDDSFSENILITEDVNVSYRQLDRSLQQLLIKESFKPKAMIFGQFYPLTNGAGGPITDETRLIYKTVIQEFAQKVSFPVYYFPQFGHGKINVPFNLGMEATVSCTQKGEYCELKQPPIVDVMK